MVMMIMMRPVDRISDECVAWMVTPLCVSVLAVPENQNSFACGEDPTFGTFFVHYHKFPLNFAACIDKRHIIYQVIHNGNHKRMFHSYISTYSRCLCLAVVVSTVGLRS